MGHPNARLTPYGRLLAVERVAAGWRVADVARQLGCSRTCIYKWWARFRVEGAAGLVDRPSRPHRVPGRTSAALEQRVCAIRRARRLGAVRIAHELGMPAATVGRIIRRYGLPRLTELDALTGEVVRTRAATRVRYERASPGELIHIDVKKLGRIPTGGGWRAHGRGARPSAVRGTGFDYLHAAVDDHSRLAYAELHADERGPTCAGFLARAAEFFASYGITRIERVMSDNAFGYRLSNDFQAQLVRLGARHVLIRPHCPWQNGKAERFIRTLQAEWSYARIYRSNTERATALPQWLEYYNTARPHQGLGGSTPISRLSPMV